MHGHLSSFFVLPGYTWMMMCVFNQNQKATGINVKFTEYSEAHILFFTTEKNMG